MQWEPQTASGREPPIAMATADSEWLIAVATAEPASGCSGDSRQQAVATADSQRPIAMATADSECLIAVATADGKQCQLQTASAARGWL